MDDGADGADGHQRAIEPVSEAEKLAETHSRRWRLRLLVFLAATRGRCRLQRRRWRFLRLRIPTIRRLHVDSGDSRATSSLRHFDYQQVLAFWRAMRRRVEAEGLQLGLAPFLHHHHPFYHLLLLLLKSLLLLLLRHCSEQKQHAMTSPHPLSLSRSVALFDLSSLVLYKATFAMLPFTKNTVFISPRLPEQVWTGISAIND